MAGFLSHPVFAFGLPHGSEWLLVLLIFFLLVPLSFLLWVGALVSCIRNETSSDTKIIWLLIILFLHFFGALAYFLVRRPQRLRELGR